MQRHTMNCVGLGVVVVEVRVEEDEDGLSW